MFEYETLWDIYEVKFFILLYFGRSSSHAGQLSLR